jgi:hypothetical protein
VSNVVALPVVKREPQKLPDDFALLTPTHALLVALDLYGDRELAYGVMALSGFSDMSFVMTWQNASLRDRLVEGSLADGVGDDGRERFLVWHLTQAGQGKLAAMNIIRKHRKVKQTKENPAMPDLFADRGTK